jgi:hypothetical protein
VPEYLRRLTNLAPSSSATKRLYLTRRNASFRRVVNEEQLLPILQRNGFEMFDPAERSVREQAAIFADAEAIVSPHSSAMTNLVFCRPGTAVMEIFAADYFDVSFWTAATSSACRYSAVMGERSWPGRAANRDRSAQAGYRHSAATIGVIPGRHSARAASRLEARHCPHDFTLETSGEVEPRGAPRIYSHVQRLYLKFKACAP